MGWLFLPVGWVLVLGYALLERAWLTEAEARQLEQMEEEEAVKPLTSAMYLDLLASRIAILAGLALAAWGWLEIAMPWYSLLRMEADISRVLAALVTLVAPVGLLSAVAWWLGHILGENLYSRVASLGWLKFAILPWRLLALPLKGLTGLLAKKDPEETSEAELMALSGSPDAFWQMVQDEDGREVAVVNRQIFDKASELQTIRVRECMTFRTDIVAVEIQEGVEGLRDAFLSSGYSKIPVYQEDLDQVLGYCHSISLFRKPKHIEDILSDVITVPESMTASQLLVELNQAQKSLAIVIDEYGGTSGVVTMEDVMEEIFGEILDEMDEQTETEIQETDDTWLLSARLEVDYLNDKYAWDLPTGEYESLGGLVVNLNQDLPEQGQVIEAPPFRFEIVGMEETRVTLVRLTFLS